MHGFLSNKESFCYQTAYFSKFYRVIAIDITGFGKSKALPYPFSIDDYLKDVLAVLDKLKIEKFYLIAHSFGGRIAIKLAGTTDRVLKLVLTGSAGLKPKRSLKYYFKVYSYKLIKRFLSDKARAKFGSEELKGLSGNMRGSYYKIVNEYLDGYLSNIRCKTLIIFGENDKETPLYIADKLNKNIKNSEKFVIKNAGHFCFIEKYYEFNLIVNEFLKE